MDRSPQGPPTPHALASEEGRDAAAHFGDGVALEPGARIDYVLDAASRTIGVVYTSPLALRPVLVALPMVDVKLMAAQISAAEAQVAIDVLARRGEGPTPGLLTKGRVAEMLVRECELEKQGRETFPLVPPAPMADEAPPAPAPARRAVPGFEL